MTRQYLTDLTWLIAILHGVLFHTDFDQYQLRMKNTRRHDTVHIPRQLVLSFASTVTRPDLRVHSVPPSQALHHPRHYTCPCLNSGYVRTPESNRAQFPRDFMDRQTGRGLRRRNPWSAVETGRRIMEVSRLEWQERKRPRYAEV